jgi:hypothetical protein
MNLDYALRVAEINAQCKAEGMPCGFLVDVEIILAAEVRRLQTQIDSMGVIDAARNRRYTDQPLRNAEELNDATAQHTEI